ncbi:MAG: terpene cyclase/mutase family protein [Planctomycetia bacterium]|nr:terpene cyclase/mutase family protein [Planctomycetia bacterium]
MKKFLTGLFCLVFAAGLFADEKRDDAIRKGVEYLRTQQAEDGSFASMMGTGPTSIVLIGLLNSGLDVDDPMVSKALKYLESQVQPDGSITNPRVGFGNYETSVAIVAFAAANKEGRYKEILSDAEKYVRKYQWDESEGIDSSDPKYGGAGYGGRMSRPDLSNTGFLLDALDSLGAKSDDPAVQKAMVFVSRCQNLESQYNTMPWASGKNDGGFVYHFFTDDKMPKGMQDGSLKTYGSMTYTGFKSMVYAGLSADDPRVKAALAWLAKNYSFQENPGQGQAGRYYYFLVMSKALKKFGHETFRDANGVEHKWAEEITGELLASQQADGSWVNDKSNRWMENNPILVTGYALMIIGNCR